jgi:hypothetical protein
MDQLKLWDIEDETLRSKNRERYPKEKGTSKNFIGHHQKESDIFTPCDLRLSFLRSMNVEVHKLG